MGNTLTRNFLEFYFRDEESFYLCIKAAETILYNALKKANLVSQKSVEAFKNPDVRQGGSNVVVSVSTKSLSCSHSESALASSLSSWVDMITLCSITF